MMNKKPIRILVLILTSIFLLVSCKPEKKLPDFKNLNAYWGERIRLDITQSNIDIYLNSEKLQNSNLSQSQDAIYFNLNRPQNPNLVEAENILEIKTGNVSLQRYKLRIDGRIKENELVVYFSCKDIKNPQSYEQSLKSQLDLDFDLQSFYQSKFKKLNDKLKIDCIANLKFKEKQLTSKEIKIKLANFVHRLIPTAKIEYNFVFINDQTSAGFFDPKCMQATSLLNESKETTAINIDKLLQGDIITLPAGTGDGVKIAVIDSGINTAQNTPGGFIDLDNSQNFSQEDSIIDVVNCKNYPNAPEPEFLNGGHGQQVVKLIHKVAADAKLTMLKVCNSNGECSSSNVSTALLYLRDLAQTGVKYDLINMSLGDDNASFISQSILSSLFALSPNTILVASAGNNPSDTEHYPASLANNASYSDNILGIAAAKYLSGNFVIANINTGKQVNSEITSLMAPGMNLIMAGSPSPLMGTSFAAPLATAIIARKKQANSNLKATDIHNQCLPASSSCNYVMVQ